MEFTIKKDVLSRINGFLNHSSYKEFIESSSSFNQKLVKERKFRLPFLDSQTGVAQSDCCLWMTKNDRIPQIDLPGGKIYIYPSKRWVKIKRQYLLDDVYLRTRSSSSSHLGPSTSTAQQDQSMLLDQSSSSHLGPSTSAAQQDQSMLVDQSSNDTQHLGQHSTNLSSAAHMMTDTNSNSSSFYNYNVVCNLSGDDTNYDDPINNNLGNNNHTGNQSSSTNQTPPNASNTNHSHSDNNNDNSPYCDFCLGDAKENKKTQKPEELVSCSDCGRSGHPTCLNFTPNIILSVKKYKWQCIECKSCGLCGTSDNDDQLLFCDDCDRGYHMYCLNPPLDQPPDGSWSCILCIKEYHSEDKERRRFKRKQGRKKLV